MAVSYITTTYLNNAGRGILSIYLMNLMGPTETGTLAAKMAPFIFVSMLATAFSAECFIRGSRRRIFGYRDRVASLLMDTLYLVGGLAYVLAQYSCFQHTRIDLLLSCILIGTAFGQISFNHLIDSKAWTYIAIANVGEIVLHAALLTIWFRNDPADQFILLAFSRWLFLNILNAVFIIRKGEISVRYARKRAIKYITHLRWIFTATRPDHLVNLSLKTLWTTMDVYLISTFWTASDAGSYRFVKSLGGLPALVLAPMWTVQRTKILADWDRALGSGLMRFKTILWFAFRFTLPLPAFIFTIYMLHDKLDILNASAYQLTVGAVLGFSMWWLAVSMFGWGRFLMVSLGQFTAGNIQNLLIVFLALSLVPLSEFIDPQVAIPTVVFMSNFVFAYYLIKK